MNHSHLKPPRLRGILLRAIAIAVPITLLLLAASFYLMYRIDRSAFLGTIDSEFAGLIATANTYDGADYTDRDPFYSRMKEALLSYSERNTAIDTYAVVVNHDGIVKVSSKASLRAYMMQIDSETGYDYYCEEPSVLAWLSDAVPDLQAEPDTRLSSVEYTIQDAFLQANGLFIPGRIIKSAIYETEDSQANRQLFKSVIVDTADFTNLAEALFSKQYVDTSGGDYRIIPDTEIRGISAANNVFRYVNEKCELLSYQKSLGTIEISCSRKLEHGSDSLLLYAHTNVFAANASRYLTVLLSLLLLAGLTLSVTVLLLYQAKKKSYEEELFRTTLMNRLSHDLKTPITAMMGYSENLLYHPGTDKREHYAKAIHSNAMYMNDILQNVLLLSKAEAGSTTLKKTLLDPVILTRTAWEKYRPMAEERNISLEITGSSESNADPALMQQLVENLLSNACKYAASDSIIQVTGKQGCFQITNLCEAPVPIDVSKLWEPFVKGDESRSNRTGTGIGLSIVKSICTLHGFKATISCEDNHFEVTIHCN